MSREKVKRVLLKPSYDGGGVFCCRIGMKEKQTKV